MSEKQSRESSFEKTLNAEKGKNRKLQNKLDNLLRLEKEWKKLSLAVTQSPSITVITNTDGLIEFVNPVFCRVTGYSVDEVMGLNLRILKSGRHETGFYQTLWDTIKSGDTWIGEFENKRKNGDIYWEAARISPLKDESGRITNFIKVSNDVTEQKRVQALIEKDLKEKKVLLKEIHHRVKNNLQIINSLLSLQAHRLDDPKILQILEQCSLRVRTMALVHEKLYQSESFSTIDFKVYIEALVIELFQAFGPGNRIQIAFQIRHVTLSLDQAIPCGLIVNELVTNALKHAFPDNRKGTIRISMHSKRGVLEIAIHDDGVGLPGDMDTRKMDSLGLRLVHILSDQLHAETNWDASQGTEFRMKFKSDLSIP